MAKKSIFIMYILLCFGFLGSSVYSAPVGPMAQIQTSVDEVISLLNDKKYHDENLVAERRKLIIEAISKRFNFRLMSKLSISKIWDKITTSDQDKFVELFSTLLKNSYIRRVEGYSDEKVSYSKETIKRNLAIVYSFFSKNTSELSVTYKMKNTEQKEWLVYDVIIEGVSIIKQYRRQFAQIVKQEKFSGLISRLEDKVAAIRKP